MTEEINILIIDDKERIREELAEILRYKYYNLILVDSADDAHKIIKNQEISIIICDINFPKAKGAELFKTIRSGKKFSDIYLLVVSTENENSVRLAESLENGAVDYLLLPFVPRLVKAKVETFYRLYLKRREIKSLLRNILPEEIVDKWQNTKNIKPLKFNEATVLFTDFIGFSKISKSVQPIELINQLDIFFGKFDEIIVKYKIERIKTIGDAYMSVAGITQHKKHHELRSVLAALEINHYMKIHKMTRTALKQPYWEARIGLNSGPLVAGVIGKHKFSYDVWGVTVNAANRIEQSSVAGSVNVSENIYKVIKKYVVAEDRGLIEIKDGNKMRMYFIHGLQEKYQFNGQSHQPNKVIRKMIGMLHIDYAGLKKEVINRLKIELNDKLVYHSLDHTLEVVKAVERICTLEGIKGLNLSLLKTAALLHDVGFIFEYRDNEKIAAQVAEEYLPKFGYEKKDINKVKALIMATRSNYTPKNIHEMIMRDADHDYLGRSDYHYRSKLLRKELKSYGQEFTDSEWANLQLTYLSKTHKYYTNSARCMRQIGKEEIIKELQETQLNDSQKNR